MKNKLVQECLVVGLTAFCVIAGGLLVFFTFYKFSLIRSLCANLVRILMPFIIGAVIAYLLSPLYNLLVSGTRSWLRKNSKLAEKYVRGISTAIGVLVSIGLALLVVSGLIALVVPQFVTSVMGIMSSMQGYIDQFSLWLEAFFKDNPEIAANIEESMSNITGEVIDWAASSLLPNLQNISGTVENVGSIVGILFSGLGVLVKVAKNAVLGFIVAAYILMGKNGMAAQSKKVIYSLFTISAANAVMEKVRYIHAVFGGFIRGKLLDSLIIGILCFVGTCLLRMPYAMVISVIIGVTNVIPFFGPFIGAIPCACLVLIISPIKCVYFVIFVLALQQFDGNILGPKILGNSTGLNSFYVLLAIILFGGLFGFVGMVIGVPLFAVIYSLVNSLVETRLKKRNMSTDTADYLFLDRVQRKEDGTCVYEKGKNPIEK